MMAEIQITMSALAVVHSEELMTAAGFEDLAI